MKKLKLTALALALFGILSAGNLWALDSTDVEVSATVEGTCSFDAAVYQMAFGTINATDVGDKIATATLDFQCTNNTAYTITDVSGIVHNMTGIITTEPLAYSIAGYATMGIADGTLQQLVLTGTIAELDYQAASADDYEDVLTISITP